MQQARDNQGSDETEASSDVSGTDALAAKAEDGNAPSRVLGLSRWVQYVFVVIGVTLFFVFDKAASLGLHLFMEPNPQLVTGVSLVLAGAIAFRLYRHDATHRYVTEVVAELAKVTWPSREETYASSVIVIITSIIAAMIIGGFDFVWSAITDLLYKYKV
jgi:preprotein translocase subunit SecE